MTRDNSINVNEIVDRLKKAEEIQSDADFARYIDMKPSALSMARKRNAIDLFQIFKKFEHYSKEWIVSGEGPMYRNELRESPDQVTYDETIEAAGLDPSSHNVFFSDILKLMDLSIGPKKISVLIKTYIKLMSHSHRGDIEEQDINDVYNNIVNDPSPADLNEAKKKVKHFVKMIESLPWPVETKSAILEYYLRIVDEELRSLRAQQPADPGDESQT